MENEMTKQWNSEIKPRPPLGIFGILKESFKTINKNAKLLVKVLVLVFLSFSMLEFAETYILAPVTKDFSVQLAKYPKLLEDIGINMHKTDYSSAMNDIRELLVVKSIFLIFSSIISLVFLVATVSSSSEAYTAKVVDFNETILKIKQSWKKPMITSFYMILIIVGSFFVFTFSIGVVSIFASNSTTLLYTFYGFLFLSILVLWFYVSALWIMSLVVSVLEDVGGLAAIVRARELMKGRKVKAWLMMVLFAFAYFLVDSVTGAVASCKDLGESARLAVSIPLANGVHSGLRLLVFVVFTVFYHDRKDSCDEKDGKGFYVPVVADEV